MVNIGIAGKVLNLALTFEVFDAQKHLDSYGDPRSCVVITKDGEMAVVGDFNIFGGICDCCKHLTFKNDVSLIALIDEEALKQFTDCEFV
ncbi:hypothetical protein [Vibrio phage vB_VhaS-tm]|nr:hypothetical protein [Vibrio phage vB_VhaS-tm]